MLIVGRACELVGEFYLLGSYHSTVGEGGKWKSSMTTPHNYRSKS